MAKGFELYQGEAKWKLAIFYRALFHLVSPVNHLQVRLEQLANVERTRLNEITLNQNFRPQRLPKSLTEVQKVLKRELLDVLKAVKK